MPNFQYPASEPAAKGGGRSEDAATLPSKEGQYVGKPTNMGMGLGPFSPRDASASMPHRHPHGAGESFGLPTASGQYPHADSKNAVLQNPAESGEVSKTDPRMAGAVRFEGSK